MAQYKGAASEGTRAVNLMKQREKQREELEKIKQKISEDVSVKNNFHSTKNKFSTHYDIVEEELKSTTVGLMTLDQMMERRELLVKEREKKLAAALAKNDSDRGGNVDGRSKIKKEEKKKMLSFNMDEEEEEEEEESNGAVSDRTKTPSDSPPPAKKPKFGRFGKNPTVDTSFLPDRDREEEDRIEREKLRQQWVEKQERIKNEDIEIVYSYWDGSGHRRRVTMKKGNSIEQFLQKCLENLRKEFTELRTCGVDGLMYIKEDLIIPQHHSFYDFILNKARGKSGPLFSFDVHEDVRLISDAGVEKDESHAGKVVLRSWYERNKHIFPASRWEPYDPEKKWDKYTISDNKD